MSIVALIGAVATGQRPDTYPWTGPAWPDCVCALGSGTPGSGALESGGPESDAVGLATQVAGDPDLSVHPWSDTVEKA